MNQENYQVRPENGDVWDDPEYLRAHLARLEAENRCGPEPDEQTRTNHDGAVQAQLGADTSTASQHHVPTGSLELCATVRSPRELYPDLPVCQRDEDAGKREVRVLVCRFAGEDGGDYHIEVKDLICALNGGAEEQHREFETIAYTQWVQSHVNQRGNRTVGHVIRWALWQMDPLLDDHAWLRDVVAAASPATQYWVAFLMPGEPSCIYGSVSKEHFEQLADAATAVRSKRLSVHELYRTLRHVAKPQGSNIDEHILVNKSFHPADPRGYEPEPDLNDEEGMQ